VSRLERLVLEVRPGVVLRSLAVHDDEAVLAGGNEVFRLPLAPTGAARLAVLVRALPALAPKVPVPLAIPRWVGVMADGTTPFTAERLLPGGRLAALGPIAAGQLAGVRAALAGVPAREARQWGVTGEGDVLVASAALLGDPARGVLTGVVGVRLALSDSSGDDPVRLADA